MYPIGIIQNLVILEKVLDYMDLHHKAQNMGVILEKVFDYMDLHHKAQNMGQPHKELEL